MCVEAHERNTRLVFKMPALWGQRRQNTVVNLDAGRSEKKVCRSKKRPHKTKHGSKKKKAVVKKRPHRSKKEVVVKKYSE